jgi:hypothetical protein
MKKNYFLIILVVLVGAGLLTGCARQEQQTVTVANSQGTPVSGQAAGPSAAQLSVERVPAHYETPPVTLPPTLPAERYKGMTRDAYQAAKEIPQTLAQLPCYCHCDQSMGHKSLHSCFEDEHAASCAICVGEALMAYRLQKQGLKPAQVRERIIAEYSKQ